MGLTGVKLCVNGFAGKRTRLRVCNRMVLITQLCSLEAPISKVHGLGCTVW